MLKSRNKNGVDDYIFALACGPDHRIMKYSSWNGNRFRTTARDANTKLKNSGILIATTHGEEEELIACHGNLKEIIKLQYHCDRSVVPFRCDWFKLEEKNVVKKDGSLKSVDTRTLWTQDDTLLLATHAKKVFYFPHVKVVLDVGVTTDGKMDVDSDHE